MNLLIIRKSGAAYSLADFGIKTLDFEVDSLVAHTVSEQISGRDGHVDVGTWYEARTMRASLFVQDYDSQLRNEIFRIFASRESFYLIDDRELGKRWDVKVSGGFSVQQVAQDKGRFTVEFIAARPFAESVKNTLSTDDTFYGNQVRQLFSASTDAEPSYEFTANTFSVYNAGDVAIDPRELPLSITYRGASTDLRIRNLTTGDDWRHTGSTNSADAITLDGVRSTRNNLSIFGATNRKLITLAPGWNDFQLTGTSGEFSIAFDFRFYFI